MPELLTKIAAVGSRRSIVIFVITVALVLSGAVLWSRRDNCNDWKSRLSAAVGGQEGLNLVGAEEFDRIFDDVGPAPYGCDAGRVRISG